MDVPTRRNDEDERPPTEVDPTAPGVPETRPLPKPSLWDIARQGFRQARAASAPASADRTTRNRDRTQVLLVMAGAVVVLLVGFLALFSSAESASVAEQARRRGQPNLGRPEPVAGQANAVPGSLTPRLEADLSPSGEPGTSEVSPDDISGTMRPRTAALDAVPPPSTRAAKADKSAPTLGSVQFEDPALEAYRREMQARGAAPTSSTPVPALTALPSSPPLGAKPLESDGLAKPSLVYVRASQSSVMRPTTASGPAAIVPSTDAPSLDLPVGTRLIARLQTAASSAVPAPVVAVIVCHYERDGEVVLPAGTKAIGSLQAASATGLVGLKFNGLELPDGSRQEIEAVGVALDLGPLRGKVTGTNRGKQILARSLTGVGTIAAFAVGRGGGFSLGGPIDNSVLLRERVAQNVAIAGEQQLMNLAFQANPVVTVPANTRFYLVLRQGTEDARPGHAGRQTPTTTASIPSGMANDLPTAAELRELIALKQELRRLYREAPPAAEARSPERD